MKKIISILIAVALGSGISAQDSKVKDSPSQIKDASLKKSKNESGSVTLDGRSFKIAFTGKQTPLAPEEGTIIPGKNEAVKRKGPSNDYSTVDANSKVIISFVSGNILSPIFAKNDCPYHLNSSSQDMVAFSAYCGLTSGNDPGTAPRAGLDTKMEINADVKNTGEPDQTDVVNAPTILPPDETKQHLPPGTMREDVPGMKNTSGKNIAPPPPQRSEDIERQSKSPMDLTNGFMATLSGVVSGNSIQGTLSWNDREGKKISYTFSGQAATKKDMNESPVVGMK